MQLILFRSTLLQRIIVTQIHNDHFIFIFGKGLIEQKKSIQLYTDTKILHIELASYWLTPSTSLQTQGVLHFRYKDKKSVLYIGDE